MARGNAGSRGLAIPPILGLIIAIAILYFAREIMIPLILALLISFLLGPLAKQFEALRLPRGAASVLAVALAFSVVAGVGWVVANQLLRTFSDFPMYAGNIEKKLEAVEGKSAGLTGIISSFEELGHNTSPEAHENGSRLERRSLRNNSGEDRPVPVEIVQQHNFVQEIRDYAGGLLKPVGMAGLALVFTIFMLIDRENMRNRLLRLMGEQRLQATTQAMDDAAQRVSRYIMMQFLVNAMFGAVTGIGLYFVGVPNWLLWGVMGLFLRFVSYVGPVVAASLPLIVALGTSVGWRMPLEVIGVYFATELVTANFVEPLLYGVNTGLSALAILASAIFWTLLWGPVGLIVSTPLTVCLSVFARYSPQFQFLNVLLGDEPVLSPDAVFYQRLLALDQNDAWTLLETLLKQKSLVAVFDEVVIPALAMAERDRHSGQLDARREEFIVQTVNEIVTELTESEAKFGETPQREGRVLCLAAADAADEIVATMMAHFAAQEGYPAITFPAGDSIEELLAALAIQPRDIICISSVPPFAASHARALAKRIRSTIRGATLIAGLWTAAPAGQNQMQRLKQAFSAAVVSSLADALAEVRSTAAASPETAPVES